ncbi:MAG: nucleoside transporter C-terminal domain-containing protein, partial [Planctomycetota bacterium]
MLISKDRSRVSWRLIVVATLFQIGIAFVLHRVPFVKDAFSGLARGVTTLFGFADEGAAFIFGGLADFSNAWGFVFFIRVFAIVIFFSALTRILYRLGVMQLVVGALGSVMRRTMGISGEEAVACAANVFVGQSEAPIAIKPYLKGLTDAQLTVVMASGFATMSGSLLGACVSIMGGGDAEKETEFAKHLITASFMSVPAAVMFARVLMPGETTDKPPEAVRIASLGDKSILEAIGNGAVDGMMLSVRIAAVVLAMVSLLALLDWPLRSIGEIPAIDAALANAGIEDLTVTTVFGYVFAPVAFMMGIAQQDMVTAGSVLAHGVIANEFIGFTELGEADAAGLLMPASVVTLSYAICGFANFTSIGV